MLKNFLYLTFGLLCCGALQAQDSRQAQEVPTHSAQEKAGQREAGTKRKAESTTAVAESSNDTGTKQALRLLYLEPKTEGLAPGDDEILAGLLYDSLGGQDRFLLITADDLRRRAPMEADRIDDCREELCLYEFSESVNASYVLFSEVHKNDDGQIQLDIALFDLADAEVRNRQTLQKDSVAAFSGFVRPAVQRILSEALQGTKPKLLENRFFLGSFSVLTLGTMAGLASLGYVMELESALARPDVHRSEKERALEQGLTAIWVGVGCATVAVLGLVSTGIAAWSHYAAFEE